MAFVCHINEEKFRVLIKCHVDTYDSKPKLMI